MRFSGPKSLRPESSPVAADQEGKALRRTPSRVYLLCGPSLAGKSAAARCIAEAVGAVVISADEINRQRGVPFGAEGLPESVWAETLRIQISQLHEELSQGRSVVVDDTLCYRWLRDRWRQEVGVAKAEPVLLLLAPRTEELIRRHARLLASAERPLLSLPRLLEHLESFEWPSAEEGAVDISTPGQLDTWLHSEAGRPPNAT